MDEKRDTTTTMSEWVARMCLLAQSNREVYREIRKLMWEFVVENSSRSDFPSNFS